MRNRHASRFWPRPILTGTILVLLLEAVGLIVVLALPALPAMGADAEADALTQLDKRYLGGTDADRLAGTFYRKIRRS
jgi:hypothetical protein